MYFHNFVIAEVETEYLLLKGSQIFAVNLENMCTCNACEINELFRQIWELNRVYSKRGSLKATVAPFARYLI